MSFINNSVVMTQVQGLVYEYSGQQNKNDHEAQLHTLIVPI